MTRSSPESTDPAPGCRAGSGVVTAIRSRYRTKRKSHAPCRRTGARRVQGLRERHERNRLRNTAHDLGPGLAVIVSVNTHRACDRRSDNSWPPIGRAGVVWRRFDQARRGRNRGIPGGVTFVQVLPAVAGDINQPVVRPGPDRVARPCGDGAMVKMVP